jgi:diguanylate cyclase (GGDEF)-like protein
MALSLPQMELTTIIAIVAFLAGAALLAVFWALPYVHRTRREARDHQAQLTAALASVRRLQDEHNRAEYLSFLNNVSKAAITSKKPVELLNQVVDELQRTFQFDHVSIGLVDYGRKEIEVRAEGGRDEYRLGLGKRVPLEAGVLGIAAQRNELRPGSLGSNQPEQEHAVLCHPITYGETLLGVLTVEAFTRQGFDQEEILTLGTLADVLATALHNAMTFEEMEYQSITDFLTGLKTRRYFLESIEAEWSRASRSGRAFSVVLIDLDKFKAVNDNLGHLEGDLVLARVARILEQKCRHSNVVARYGGDEFIVLMPETSLDQAQKLSERLRSALASDSLLSQRKVTGSCGIASFPVHGATIEELIREADQAMYRSKTAGGNRVSLPSEPRESSSEQNEARVGI